MCSSDLTNVRLYSTLDITTVIVDVLVIYKQGEEWNPVTPGTNVWTDASAGATTWTQTSGDQTTWTDVTPGSDVWTTQNAGSTTWNNA